MNNATAVLLGAILVVGGIAVYAVIDDDAPATQTTVVEEEQGVAEAMGEAIDEANEESDS